MSAAVAPVSEAFFALQPAAVWRHFATICATPRASGHEERLRSRLLAWALEQGLDARVDGAGNLLVAKPASAGYESAPGFVLQAHLDMVCQKNSDSMHDFSRDPIVPVCRDGWLSAEATTLGADNGIGASLILAALEDRSLAHGPLEALLTVGEEAGMDGARGLAPEALHGRAMLNLDSEDWGEFYLGCAGGLDVDVSRPGASEAVPAGHRGFRIILRGLRGGHSGVDIHEERGNAIKLLVQVLRKLEQAAPLRLARLQGGSARNALAREAFACCTLPAAAAADLPAFLTARQAELRRELAGVDEGLTLAFETDDTVAAVLSRAEQAVWLASLHAAPHGVRRMSRRVPGVVETSNNLGMVDLGPQAGSCNFMVRSLIDEGSRALAEEIASLFSLSGTAVRIGGYYPGWSPDPDSPLLRRCQSVFRREFHAEAAVKVIHAGLECGIISGKYPGMDIVSFGPTIRGAHAPGERVEIASVERCWRLLTAILAERTA
jgi:dipeptidase D